MPHHLIFEGAELAGKSWLMSQVYDHLEPKYNQNRVVLDGCHWFNSDVGVFGTEYGRKIIQGYLEMFTTLKDKNLVIEKFHLSDIVYNRLHFQREVDYATVEKKLSDLNFKIILITFPENTELIKKRIQDRLNLYPHYERILQNSDWYIKQQKEYLGELEKTKLPYLIVETKELPDEKKVNEILSWIGEK